MKLTDKSINITRQILIIFFFFSGMLLNYFMLTPIIDDEETARIRADVDDYCQRFYPYDGFCIDDPAQMDSLVRSTPKPYDGDVIIAHANQKVIYTSIQTDSCETVSDILNRRFGKVASDLLELELRDPGIRSRLSYEKETKISFYACYEPKYDLLFFYVTDYRIAGSELSSAFSLLLLFMSVGGLIVIVISYFNIRKLTQKIKNESVANKELETAFLIQKSMLPDSARHLMQVDIDARLVPALKVGGDFYYYILKDGLLYFCIGDVSGKGVPASLFMTKAVTLFRGFVNLHLSPREVATKMNDELCIHNYQNMFLTSVIGSINLADGAVTVVNSGHEPPLLWDGNDSSKPYLMETSGNIPLGVIPSQSYVEDHTTIEKNGLMFLYTDGVSEAKSRNTGFFGRGALLDMIDQVKDLNSKEINDRVMERLASFESGVEQSDDITLLTFRNIGTPMDLVICSDVKELRKFPPYIERVFKECRMDDKTSILVRSALDEALTNCVKYAYDAPGGLITLRTEMKDGFLVFTLSDFGREFNPLEYVSSYSGEDLKVGGLGISMMKSSFDNLSYRREGNQNILILFKKI